MKIREILQDGSGAVRFEVPQDTGSSDSSDTKCARSVHCATEVAEL